MPTEVVMPEIGETVVSGTIVTWLKEIGDEVGIDESLVEVATDKANVEIPSPAAGILRKKLAEEGDEVEVGAVLAIITAPDEELEAEPAEVVEEEPESQPQKTDEPVKAVPKEEAQPAAAPEPAAGRRRSGSRRTWQ